MTHVLKCWPPYFEAVANGSKTFELRFNDRGFSTGNLLLLQEFRPESKSYTGREVTVSVEYILYKCVGLDDGYVVMGIKKEQS